MKNAKEAFQKLLAEYQFRTVLDIGCGEGQHARAFKAAGKKVTTIALHDADVVGDFVHADLGRFDCLWASHVLEHQLNVCEFLHSCWDHLEDNGILCITVPPAKPEIVGGHVTVWNTGLLLYNLILAGFDCSEARCKRYGYNISVIVRKKLADLPELSMDAGDIEKLAKFFPMPVKSGFDGNINEVNWS
jgi:SAM-dependent methyltransferase